MRVLLKDGTFLNCVIYHTGEPGEFPIINPEEINNKFQKRSNEENFINGLIHFQTSLINGKFHVNNVLWYDIGAEVKENE